jgi:2,3-bisphosphoglycerate-dependent phosphoglycerate mutase
MPYLLLARHGESEFDAKNTFTGLQDAELTQKGRDQAALMATAVKDIKPGIAFSSSLGRAKESLAIIFRQNAWENIPVVSNQALNERDYGTLTGKNKAELAQKYGEDQLQKWRRAWSEPIDGGETLREVYQRVVLYFTSQILPNLKRGQDVLIVAHGNTLRALVKHLDNLDDNQVETLEMPLAEIIVYDYEMSIASKQVRKFESTLPFVTVNSTYIKN